eukprot:Gb_23287 [translate_table: standard]
MQKLKLWWEQAEIQVRHIVSPSERWVRIMKQIKGCIEYQRAMLTGTDMQIQQAKEELTQILSQSNTGTLIMKQKERRQMLTDWISSIKETWAQKFRVYSKACVQSRVHWKSDIGSLTRGLVYQGYKYSKMEAAKIMFSKILPLPDEQLTSIRGQRIADNITIVSEAIYSARTQKMLLMVLKLDISKSYDTLEWDYILAVLKCKTLLSHLCCKRYEARMPFVPVSVCPSSRRFLFSSQLAQRLSSCWKVNASMGGTEQDLIDVMPGVVPTLGTASILMEVLISAYESVYLLILYGLFIFRWQESLSTLAPLELERARGSLRSAAPFEFSTIKTEILSMETPSSETRMSRTTPFGPINSASKPAKGNVFASAKKLRGGSRRALLDVTNDSPIVGLALERNEATDSPASSTNRCPLSRNPWNSSLLTHKSDHTIEQRMAVKMPSDGKKCRCRTQDPGQQVEMESSQQTLYLVWRPTGLAAIATGNPGKPVDSVYTIGVFLTSAKADTEVGYPQALQRKMKAGIQTIVHLLVMRRDNGLGVGECWKVNVTMGGMEQDLIDIMPGAVRTLGTTFILREVLISAYESVYLLVLYGLLIFRWQVSLSTGLLDGFPVNGHQIFFTHQIYADGITLLGSLRGGEAAIWNSAFFACASGGVGIKIDFWLDKWASPNRELFGQRVQYWEIKKLDKATCTLRLLVFKATIYCIGRRKTSCTINKWHPDYMLVPICKEMLILAKES